MGAICPTSDPYPARPQYPAQIRSGSGSPGQPRPPPSGPHALPHRGGSNLIMSLMTRAHQLTLIDFMIEGTSKVKMDKHFWTLTPSKPFDVWNVIRDACACDAHSGMVGM